MNNSVFIALVVKDLYRLKSLFIGYGLTALIFLALMAIPNAAISFMSTVLMLTVLVVFYCHMSFNNLVFEIKHNNHLFLMSLPTSPKTLTWAKLTSSLIAFFAVWGGLYSVVAYYSTNFGYWPAISFGFFSSMFCLYVPAFFIILFVGLWRGSEGALIASFVTSNVGVTILGMQFHRFEEVQEGLSQGSISDLGVQWLPLFTNILKFEWTVAGCLLVFIVILVSLKKDYL